MVAAVANTGQRTASRRQKEGRSSQIPKSSGKRSRARRTKNEEHGKHCQRSGCGQNSIGDSGMSLRLDHRAVWGRETGTAGCENGTRWRQWRQLQWSGFANELVPKRLTMNVDCETDSMSPAIRESRPKKSAALA